MPEDVGGDVLDVVGGDVGSALEEGDGAGGLRRQIKRA